MHAIRCRLRVVVCSLVVHMTLCGLAVSAPASPPNAQDPHGPIVILRVRALVPDKVALSEPAQGIVRATVLTIDKEINQIKVQTPEGQRLVLFLTPASLADLRIGAPCLLQVGQSAPHAPPRPPERAEVVW